MTPRRTRCWPESLGLAAGRAGGGAGRARRVPHRPCRSRHLRAAGRRAGRGRLPDPARHRVRRSHAHDRPTEPSTTLGELRADGYRLAQRQGGDARQPGWTGCARRAAPARHHRLRRDGPAADRERDAGRPGHHPAGGARAGQEPHRALAGGAAGRMDAGGRRRGAARRPAAPGQRRSPAPWWRKRATPRRSPGCIATTATARSSPRPDITIADLVGEVDPVKVAEGRYLSDELTIHYGLLPRTNRGIFTLNELPDLAERIQVGLLNLMEERDVQIRGYKVRLQPGPVRRRVGQPGGLHQPRPDHHAAEGPIRGADPHPLPGGSGDRDRHHGGRVDGLRRRDGGIGPGAGARLHAARSWPSCRSSPAARRRSASAPA